MEESKGLPCQVPTKNVSKWFKFRVNVDQVRFHGLYRCLCKDFYVEGRFACLATDIIPLPYLFIDARTSVSDIQTVPNLPVFCGGRGGLSKIRACPYFGKCGNLRTVPKGFDDDNNHQKHTRRRKRFLVTESGLTTETHTEKENWRPTNCWRP